MGLSSLRVRALGMVERTLRRWLDAVEDQLEPADQPPAPPAREPFVSRQPAPPAHWVELVRASAPQLLESNASLDAGISDDASLDDGTSSDTSNAAGLVIDYRAPEASMKPTSPLPLRVAPVAPLRRSVHPPVSATTSPKRPLRLEPIRTRIPADETLISHSADVGGDAIAPRQISTNAPPVAASRGSLTQADAVSVLPPTHRTDSAANPPQIPLRTRYRSLETNPLREVSTSPGENEPIAAHFADLPTDPTLRTASTSVPNRADIPIIRTRTAREQVSLNQPRTSVPSASPQVAVRSATVPDALNLEDVQPERWPSLPELPDEVAPSPDTERQRRERLRREQEGRAWSE